MNQHRLRTILDKFRELRILVVGDYCLDRYHVVEPSLCELSLETGKEAHQVVEKRCWPGGAGVVAMNLKYLGIKRVIAMGIVGNDGDAHELLNYLEHVGIDTNEIIRDSGRITPAFIKTMILQEDKSEVESVRYDIRSRRPIKDRTEDMLLHALEKTISRVNGVMVCDQVPERNFGVITDKLRTKINSWSYKLPDEPILADSRMRINLFENVIVKPNQYEAIHALPSELQSEIKLKVLISAGRRLIKRNRGVYITLGERGLLCFWKDHSVYVSAVPIDGPIDPVGAGDVLAAATLSSLCSGANYIEAGLIGCMAASVSAKQLGTTGICRQIDLKNLLKVERSPPFNILS